MKEVDSTQNFDFVVEDKWQGINTDKHIFSWEYEENEDSTMRKLVTILIVIMLVAVVTIGLWKCYRYFDEYESDAWERWIVNDPEIVERPNGTLAEIQVTAYFNGDEGLRSSGGFIYKMAYRMSPAAGANSQCDRIYTAEGNDSAFTPYGLYAYDPVDGQNQWSFKTESRISTELHVINYGSDTNSTLADLRIIYGCENGRLYILQDAFVDPAWGPSPPSGNNVWSAILDSPIVGIDCFKPRDYYISNPAFNNNDLVCASTTNGTLFAFRGPIPEFNPATGLYNDTAPTLLWQNHISEAPLSTPTVSEDGNFVFVGSTDGLLYGIDVSSGLKIPEWGEPYRVSDIHWDTAPIATGTPTVVYASTGDGFIHCVWGRNGTCKQGWTHTDSATIINGIPMIRNGAPDDGLLTDIFVTPDGRYVLVGSDSGFVYSINTVSATITFAFDTRIGTQDTEVNVMPFYDRRFSKFLFVAARHLNNTADDPSDDFSILYCLGSPGNATIIWRQVKDGVIITPPIGALVDNHIGSTDIIFSTVIFDSNGVPTDGRMYSISASGRLVDVEAKTPGFDFLILSAAVVVAVTAFPSIRKRMRN